MSCDSDIAYAPSIRDGAHAWSLVIEALVASGSGRSE
jgi:hypothetical protein